MMTPVPASPSASTARLLHRLGIEYPLLQAPVGGAAGPELAAAVSVAGGMGALPLTWTTPELAGQLVRAVRDRTDRPFQVNFVLAFPPTALTAALEAGAPVVTFSWGDPASHIRHVREFGAAIGIQVTSVEGARRALALEPDFLICQGVEAGGHVQATRSLWEVLPGITDVCGTVPVVAAGGIGNGGGVHAALSQGAAGAMLGTRFVASQESRAHAAYQQAIIGARASSAVLTVCYDRGWPYAPHRVLLNSTIEHWEAAGCPRPGRRPGEDAIVATSADGAAIRRYEDTTPLAGTTGDVGAMALYAGTSCGVIDDVPPVAEIVRRTWREYRDAASVTAAQTANS